MLSTHQIYQELSVQTNPSSMLLRMLAIPGNSYEQRQAYLQNTLQLKDGQGLNIIAGVHAILRDYESNYTQIRNRAYAACPLTHIDYKFKDQIKLEVEAILSAAYLEEKFPGTKYINPTSQNKLEENKPAAEVTTPKFR